MGVRVENILNIFVEFQVTGLLSLVTVKLLQCLIKHHDIKTRGIVNGILNLGTRWW
jgi:hypothetical protein